MTDNHQGSALAKELERQHAAQLQQYAAIANRRNAIDTLLWQAPMISLTAQAFLFTTAATTIGKECGSVLYSVSFLLAWLAACASLHLMIKHRFFEVVDSITLQQMEVILGLPCRHYQAKASKSLGSAYKTWVFVISCVGTAAGLFFAWSLPQFWPYLATLMVLSFISYFFVTAWTASPFSPENERMEELERHEQMTAQDLMRKAIERRLPPTKAQACECCPTESIH